MKAIRLTVKNIGIVADAEVGVFVVENGVMK